MDNLFLKTAICCMACDGEISDEEVKLLSSTDLLSAIIENGLNSEISLFKVDGKKYLNEYIVLLSKTSSTILIDDKIKILKIAVDMIKADGIVKYSEIKFFKLILSVLDIAPKLALDNLEGIDEDWVDNDFSQSKDDIYQSFFSSFKLPSISDDTLHQFESIKEN